MQRKLSIATAFTISLLALACAKKPPEVPELDEPEPPPTQEAEPPAKPACDDLQKPCAVKANEPVSFADDTLTFQPPEGWSYVLVDQGVTTFSEDHGAALTFAVTDAALTPKSKAGSILVEVKPLLTTAKVSGVTEKVLKKSLRKSPVVEQAGDLSLNTWQVPAKVDDKDGMSLVILAELPSGKRLVGIVALQKEAVKDNGQLAHDAYLSLKGAQ